MADLRIIQFSECNPGVDSILVVTSDRWDNDNTIQLEMKDKSTGAIIGIRLPLKEASELSEFLAFEINNRE